uniref:Uncharacterized protein n=1 Tax=Coturnix japonica TaxID=93934 RepID=A0A8C2SLR1_COTJA
MLKLISSSHWDHQSPSDTKTKEVKEDAPLGLLQIFWKPSICKEIVNDGHSFHVNSEEK